MTCSDEHLLRRAIAVAHESRRNGGEPFGAVLAFNGEIVHEASDESLSSSDPTRHAELNVISEYCRKTLKFHLGGYALYSNAEPCSMCSGAIFWSRLSKIVFSVSQEMLRELSNGPPRRSCSVILNPDVQRVKIVGPLLSKEGLDVFKDFVFGRKLERWEALLSTRPPTDGA